MSKRANGEGTVSRVKDRENLWRGQWTEVVDGRRVRRTVYGRSHEEASEKIRQATGRVREGIPGTDSTSPFRDVAERWRRTAAVSQGLGSRSMGTYGDVLRLHVHPVIGDLPIRDVKPSHVAEVMARMQARGLSRSYQHQAHKAISNVFRMAIADELVIRNPTRSVKAPRGGHKPKVVPTREQVMAMIEGAPDARMRAFVAVLAYSGLRIGEALALRWSDWSGATIAIRYGKGGKSRAIPVPELLAAELRRWRKAQTAERLASPWWDDSADWILSTEVGTRWDPHNARKRFKPLADGRKALPGRNGRPGSPALPAVCPGATPHSLRHATATILLEQGVPMRVVSDLLGHSSTRITEDVYSHVTARLLSEAASALDDALGG